uniref:Terminase large subunit GpA endonuclease domain-containing protein n=1 Tax=Candidatus Nitrotoga fabula TaxID=2182327 RepID=A0A2X0QSF1_9PROT|nr:protein of unknown function [Candidatus Nitrotoga fabula]
MIYSRLKLIETGPGYIHFANDPAFDDEYFAQLAAEKLVTKVRGTRPYQEWIQMRPRNEALDCMVYATAAMRLSRKPLDGPLVIRREEKPQPIPQPQQQPQPVAVIQPQEAAVISKGKISVSGLRQW